MIEKLGIGKVIEDGNGNAIIYTALLAAAIANTLPTPFDAVYLNRINKLERQFDNGEISAEKLEYHVAAEYYLWTTLWYVTLFSGIYLAGGKYKNNAKVLLALVGGGLVIGVVQKNIEYDKEVAKRKATKSNPVALNQQFTGFSEKNYWNDAFNQFNSYTPTDSVKTK